jgi:4,5-dihydroxyphthalate decarboxylase
MSRDMRVLRTAIGRTRYTDPLFTGAVASPWLRLALEPFTTISRAFAPMVRELAFDVSVLAARFQEASLLCLKASPLRGPPDLKGRRIGVRTYSQTTGMWLRGFLEERYGVRPQDARWLTFEGAHVSEYADPPWAERAASGQDMLSLLRAGELDAVIVGNDMPEGDDLRPVVADAKAVGEAFFARHGFVPVNHLLTLRREIAEGEPEVVAELMRLFREVKAGQPVEGRDPRPIGREAIDPAITLAVRYCVAQGLLPRALSLDEVWG